MTGLTKMGLYLQAFFNSYHNGVAQFWILGVRKFWQSEFYKREDCGKNKAFTVFSGAVVIFSKRLPLHSSPL